MMIEAEDSCFIENECILGQAGLADFLVLCRYNSNFRSMKLENRCQAYIQTTTFWSCQILDKDGYGKRSYGMDKNLSTKK